jgi:hypothetical protein
MSRSPPIAQAGFHSKSIRGKTGQIRDISADVAGHGVELTERKSGADVGFLKG